MVGWLVAAVLIGAVVPFTLIGIMPTNHKLLAPGRDLGSAETRGPPVNRSIRQHSDGNSTRRKDKIYGNTRATAPNGSLPDGNRLLYLARDLRRRHTRDCRPARPRLPAIQRAGEGDRNACGIAHKSVAPPGKRRSVYRAGRRLLCADTSQRMPANRRARIDALCSALVCRHHTGGLARS